MKECLEVEVREMALLLHCLQFMERRDCVIGT